MSSFIGLFAILGVAYLLSENKKNINIRTVLGALAIQFAFALLVFKTSFGTSVLNKATNAVNSIMAFSAQGTGFVFGPLADFSVGFIFFVNVLMVIVFFSALTAALYHLGVMQIIVNSIGGALQKVLGTKKPESLSAAANIFLGQTEAPFFIKPLLGSISRAELFAVMVGGLGSIAGSILLGLSGMGVPIDYIIAACFMAAPGALLIAKIIIPNEEKDTYDVNQVLKEKSRPNSNLIEAIATGASEGMSLVINIAAALIALIAIVAMINALLGSLGSLVGLQGLSVETILGFILSPVAYILGVPWGESFEVASLLGKKIVFNEFMAYGDLVAIKDTLSERATVIATFALCGFANISSMAIIVNGIGGMAPERRSLVSKLSFKALIAGTLSNFLSACIASIVIFM